MKTILVDAIGCFVQENGEIFHEMYELLEKYQNKKIILTSANDEQFAKYGLDRMPYEVFSLKHNPEKSDPNYYLLMLSSFNLKPSEVVYFEHGTKAVESASSAGILTLNYDSEKKDLVALKEFLEKNL